MKQIIHRIIERTASVVARRTADELRQTLFWDARTINAAIELQREIDRIRSQLAEKMPGCPLLYGYSVFSQCDEDGIIAHILESIRSKLPLARTCIEFGVGNGLENNTHFLVLQGFKGFWVDGNPRNLESLRAALDGLEFDRLVGRCAKIDLENLMFLLGEAQNFVGSDIDLFSLDLDGNDLHFLRESLRSIRPKVVVAEYNSKFHPPAHVTIQYDKSHVWSGDDFYGASLNALVDALEGYRLVSCNLSGVNAFFVRNDLADLFPNYTLEQLYQPFRLYLAYLKTPGFAASMKYLKQSLKKTNGSHV
jgi:hypothetical protein